MINRLNKKSLYILISLSLMMIIIFLFNLKDYLSVLDNLFLYIFIVLLISYLTGVILIVISLNSDMKHIKNIGIIITVIISIISLIGIIIATKINTNINKAYINDDYYNARGYVSYNNKYNDYKDIDELKNINNLNVGVIKDRDSDYLGKDSVDNLFNNSNIIYYDDNFSLYKDLVDNNLDIAIFDSSYRMSVKANKEYSYYKYIDNISDLYSFNNEVKNNKESLDNNTFNILLIGYAPENKDETVGLADGIMLATINLDSLSINLKSIARSSDVSFACAGGIRSRINETILYDRKCLLDTSSELLDTNIDYYIEINFNGLVELVDALGGITVNSDIEFVGQTNSYERGDKTIYIPSGENVYLNGEQALAFVRERYAYSEDDDLTRQNNQQQVLSRIIEKLLNNKNLFELMDVIDTIGNNVKTNINKKQILNILDRIFDLNDCTGISLFNKLEINNNQLVGKYIESYDYYSRHPLWVYRLYDESIVSCKENILDALGIYNDVSQKSYLKFFNEYPYKKDVEEIDYSNILLSEEIPDYYPTLIGMNMDEALNWANENDVELDISYIDLDNDKYDEAKIGQVISQSVEYGSLVDEYPNCEVEFIPS